MQTNAPLYIYQGDDYAGVVTVLDSNGAAVDLTGYTPKAQIRLGPADHNPVVVDITTSLVLPNMVSLSIPHSMTTTLNGNYVWDFQLTASDSTIETLLAGGVVVTLEVTR
jgi:hypothetical protein